MSHHGFRPPNLFNGTFEQVQQWMPFVNQHSTTAPAYAPMVITGLDSQGRLTVTRVSISGTLAGVVFNGPVAVPSGAEGVCTTDQVFIAAVGAVGDLSLFCATIADQWYLASSTGYNHFLPRGPSNNTALQGLFIRCF